MLLEFSVKNYRSFKGECTFSMIAEASRSKSDNIFVKELSNSDRIRLLKSAVIYGPNASGKSNLLRAINTLKKMSRSLARAGSQIKYYDPYLFNSESNIAPTTFKILFVGPNDHKYYYQITYNKEEVLDETLDYYPLGQKRNLFKRSYEVASSEMIHLAKLGSDLNNKSLKVLRNQTLLSKFGTDEPDEILTPIYLYFQERLKIVGNYNLSQSRHLVEETLNNSPTLHNQLNRLIRVADTKINEVVLKKYEEDKSLQEGRYRRNINMLIEGRLREYNSFGKHSIYDNGKEFDSIELPFDEESKGTNVLFVLGTLILETLQSGGLFLIDEIDTSLHPKLAKFLVLLFQHPKSNPNNAQLVFTTHETTFLDKDVFRRDQIWFVEKNELGESDLFSVQDFDNVRETTPFEKWYLAGKFGGLPEIKEIEFIFQDE